MRRDTHGDSDELVTDRSGWLTSNLVVMISSCDPLTGMQYTIVIMLGPIFSAYGVDFEQATKIVCSFSFYWPKPTCCRQNLYETGRTTKKTESVLAECTESSRNATTEVKMIPVLSLTSHLKGYSLIRLISYLSSNSL